MNGCHNRTKLRHTITVQVGWHNWEGRRYPTMKTIPDPLSKDCQYQKTQKNDPQCEGCKHLQKE